MCSSLFLFIIILNTLLLLFIAYQTFILTVISFPLHHLCSKSHKYMCMHLCDPTASDCRLARSFLFFFHRNILNFPENAHLITQEIIGLVISTPNIHSTGGLARKVVEIQIKVDFKSLDSFPNNDGVAHPNLSWKGLCAKFWEAQSGSEWMSLWPGLASSVRVCDGANGITLNITILGPANPGNNWFPSSRIHLIMLLTFLREAGHLFMCPAFAPASFHQEVEIQAPKLEQGISPPHPCSSLGFINSCMGTNLTQWIIFRFELSFDGVRISNIEMKTTSIAAKQICSPKKHYWFMRKKLISQIKENKNILLVPTISLFLKIKYENLVLCVSRFSSSSDQVGRYFSMFSCFLIIMALNTKCQELCPATYLTGLFHFSKGRKGNHNWVIAPPRKWKIRYIGMLRHHQISFRLPITRGQFLALAWQVPLQRGSPRFCWKCVECWLYQACMYDLKRMGSVLELIGDTSLNIIMSSPNHKDIQL
ncbi:hypothetical protein VP01_2755g2 [Puccinia sorghi]|uniref:Uncharacterized protein n=1 Tax=Puccinia sorghi TaxID=27349 RepID=A0A0L6V300_9BASI|nr:hypothetical protein VP01_2755g2 [Puccinia sorghi]